MHVKDGLLSAFQSISSHKLRSLLTLTGIVIGVLAVVAMFSSVYALKDLVKSNMEGMGWDHSLIIVPQMGDEQGGIRRSFRRARQSVETISYDDYIALRDGLEYKTIYGNIESNSLYRLKNKTQFVRLRATNRSFFTVKSYALGAGRLFNPYEEENRIPVAVLGHYFAKDYFGDKDPIGESIKLGNTRFTVVGVLSED
ncbi:MAG: ABC transporter permease, partial [Candidatus Cloacimonadota bacterium]